MAEQVEETEGAAKKRSKLPLILGLVGFLALGGGGFFAAYSGLLPIGGGTSAAADHGGGPDSGGSSGHGGGDDHGGGEVVALGDIAFVPVEPVIINLGGGGNRHLRFRAELEVDGGHSRDVETLMPRIVDVINGYLRAISLADLEEPTALVRLRAQLLRRIQVVAGEGRVRDLLIMEFVLN